MFIATALVAVALLPPNPRASETYAAEEYAAWTAKLTGSKAPSLEIRRDDALGEDGFRLQNVGGTLVVSGGRRGVLYGVYEALERFGGVEWLSSDTTVVPEKGKFVLPANLDETQKPAFELREPYWYDAMRDPDFAARLKINASQLKERHGGCSHLFDSVLGNCHTFEKLVPQAEHFEKHPEYYSSWEGKRRKGTTQLCLTNPDVLKIVTAKVLERIEANPKAKYFGVSQNDWGYYCTCTNCAAIDAEEESHAGALVRFVNAVADEVAKKHPDKVIETLAYQWSRKPPKKTKLRKNVMPCLCSIECAFRHPLAKSKFKDNVSFLADLRGWAAQTDQLYVWDYTTNFADYLYPFPNVLALQENIRTFRANKVKSLFEQGAYQGRHADFAELKTWLLAKWMWNPDLPMEPLLDRFFRGYYGAAAPVVRQYFDELHALPRAEEGVGKALGIYESVYSPNLPDAFLARASALWDEAEALVKDDPVRARNVRMGRITVDSTRLMRHRGLEARWNEYQTLAKRLLAAFDKKNAIRFSESGGLDAAVLSDWKKIAEATSYEEASRSLVLDTPNRHAPCIGLDRLLFAEGSFYTLRVHVRGGGFEAGVDVWDSVVNRGRRAVEPKSAADDWAWYDVLTWQTGPGEYFWFRPLDGKTEIDKIELVPEKEFTAVDLAPLGKAGAFGDAVWKDALGAGENFTFFGVPFRLMAPEKTADPSFAVDLKRATYAEAAFLFCVDEANPAALPFMTLRFSVGGKTGDVHVDLRGGEGPTAAPEVGRILRGPSGTLHFPVRFARVPLHPDVVAAAEEGKDAMKLEVLAPGGRKSAFTVAALTMIAKTPLREAKDGIQLSFDLDLAAPVAEGPLYAAEGALKVCIRDAKKHPAPGNYDERSGNYYNFSLPDGSCPVVEALLPGPTGRIGIPLGALKNPFGRHRVKIVVNNAYFTLDVDERRDEDLPFEPLLWPVGEKGAALSERVSNLAFRFGAPRGPVAREDALQRDFRAMYWNPADHNRWVGDVVTATWDGTLHVFYLVDRRHHNSKGGRGGHWFEHVATDDLVHWRELPTAVASDENWEYVGTGTPFKMDGKYCLAYGLHTTRHGPLEKIRAMGLPFGGSYATSTDGVHFTKSHVVITDDQNPSVYNRPDGLFGMGCISTLKKSASVKGPWETVVADAPAFGDCPCPFEWNGWHYVIQGFCTMARSKTGENGTYTDEVMDGYDVYEGLSVPMVAPWKDNRRLLIGWINHVYGWGGWLCARELVQYPDGHLGTKWVKEMPMPSPVKTYKVNPGETFTLAFTGGKGGDFAFVLDGAKGKARFVGKAADGTYPDIPTLSEMAQKNAAKYGARRIFAGRKHRPDEAGDFAIGKIRGLDKPFEVRVVNHFDKKSGVTLVDVEIAGARTMVTRRLGSYRCGEPILSAPVRDFREARVPQT